MFYKKYQIIQNGSNWEIEGYDIEFPTLDEAIEWIDQNLEK